MQTLTERCQTKGPVKYAEKWERPIDCWTDSCIVRVDGFLSQYQIFALLWPLLQIQNIRRDCERFSARCFPTEFRFSVHRHVHDSIKILEFLPTDSHSIPLCSSIYGKYVRSEGRMWHWFRSSSRDWCFTNSLLAGITRTASACCSSSPVKPWAIKLGIQEHCLTEMIVFGWCKILFSNFKKIQVDNSQADYKRENWNYWERKLPGNLNLDWAGQS